MTRFINGTLMLVIGTPFFVLGALYAYARGGFIGGMFTVMEANKDG